MARIDPIFADLAESATLAVNQRARALRAAGETVWHFGFGESPFPVPEPMRAALVAHAGEKHYLPGEGLPELRRAAAAFLRDQWSCAFEAEQVFVGPGSKELIYDLLAILSGPVLAPVPAWVSYAPQAHLLRKDFVAIETRFEDGYRLQADALRNAARAHPGQKILILNNPVNPTGTVYGSASLHALAEVCREEDILVIADEIYGLLDFGLVDRCSMAQVLPERTIVTTGISKTFAAGGWRLGIAAIPDALGAVHGPLRAMISETFSAVAAPIQFGAVPAFEFGSEIRAFVERARRIQGHASTRLQDRFRAMGLNCPPAEGAFYLFPDFGAQREALARLGIDGAAPLAERLLEEARVAVLPGGAFGMAPEHLGVRVAAVDYDGAHALAEFDRMEDPSPLFPRLEAGCDALEAFLARHCA